MIVQFFLYSRGSNKRLGSPNNGNFLRLFELLTKRDAVLNELLNKIIRHNSKQHYFSKYIQNKLMNHIARQAKKVLLTQLNRPDILL